ncbi:unnamed protein product [Victoria cruziana]
MLVYPLISVDTCAACGSENYIMVINWVLAVSPAHLRNCRTVLLFISGRGPLIHPSRHKAFILASSFLPFRIDGQSSAQPEATHCFASYHRDQAIFWQREMEEVATIFYSQESFIRGHEANFSAANASSIPGLISISMPPYLLRCFQIHSPSQEFTSQTSSWSSSAQMKQKDIKARPMRGRREECCQTGSQRADHACANRGSLMSSGHRWCTFGLRTVSSLKSSTLCPTSMNRSCERTTPLGKKLDYFRRILEVCRQTQMQLFKTVRRSLATNSKRNQPTASYIH